MNPNTHTEKADIGKAQQAALQIVRLFCTSLLTLHVLLQLLIASNYTQRAGRLNLPNLVRLRLPLGHSYQRDKTDGDALLLLLLFWCEWSNGSRRWARLGRFRW